ncbi:MAG: hypothetical protein GY814_00640 [Gammaproteobacteria bacterium]|nr:hypothetical protein [Gammaproteobacteria bacterium]
MIKPQTFYMLYVVSAFFAFPVTADSEVNKFTYSVYAKEGGYSVNDPDGNTDSNSAVVPGVKINYDLPRRGQRIFSYLEYTSFDLDGNNKNIAQDVAGYTFGGGYEYRIPLSRQVKVWLGAGLSVNSFSFGDRYQTTYDGYLERDFPNRDETLLGANFTADTYFDVGANWALGLGAYWDTTFGDGVEGYGLKLTLLKK